MLPSAVHPVAALEGRKRKLKQEIQNLVTALVEGNNQAPRAVLSAIKAREDLLAEVTKEIEALKQAPPHQG